MEPTIANIEIRADKIYELKTENIIEYRDKLQEQKNNLMQKIEVLSNEIIRLETSRIKVQDELEQVAANLTILK